MPDPIQTRAAGALLLAISLLLQACSLDPGELPAPGITAQGFGLDEPRQGEPGQFGDIRVRIEAAAGIDQLLIAERSYEVELAGTREPSHFPLFGLDRRVETRTDITLNFKPYVNLKLVAPGDYTIDITVIDKQQRVAAAQLAVLVEGAVQPTPVEEAEQLTEAQAESLPQRIEPSIQQVKPTAPL
jgi:hypothetical protein